MNTIQDNHIENFRSKDGKLYLVRCFACDPKHGREDATVQERGQVTGQLNPTWVEWLMGYPSEWTVLEPWAMQWFRPKRGKLLKD